MVLKKILKQRRLMLEGRKELTACGIHCLIALGEGERRVEEECIRNTPETLEKRHLNPVFLDT